MKIFSKFALCFFISCCFLIGLPSPTQAQVVGNTVGSIAPNIELPDQYNNKISLSDLRGNLVLLRFWRSGDPNSRATNSSINTLYEKYKNASFQTAKGFQVFTVSLDGRLDKWKMALTEDQLPANYHVHDIYSKYVAPYGVRSFPSNFLLDERGMIIAQTNSMAALDMELSKRAQVYVSATTQTSSSSQSSGSIITTPPTSNQGGEDIVNTGDTPIPSTFTQPTSVPTINMTGGETTYMIQLGAYKNLDEGRFLNASEYGFVTTEEAGNGVKRALLGKFTTPEDMVSTLSKLRDMGYKDAFPVEYKGNVRSRVVGKKETLAIAADMGISITEAIITTPPPTGTNSTPSTMSVATTTTPAPPTHTTGNQTGNTSSMDSKAQGGTYQYPFANTNSDDLIMSIPDNDISATYHNGGGNVITTTTTTRTNTNGGNVATFNSGHSSTTGYVNESKTTVVPSEIPVFTGGVTPSTDSNGGTYYDSDAYELSWYPSTPSSTQPSIIESPYYNNNPISRDPNAPTVPNYDNGGNNNGWQQSGWNNNGSANTNTNTNTNPQWNNNGGGNANNNGWSEWQSVDNMNNNANPNNTQPTTDGQWNNGQETTPDTDTYPEPNNQELDKSLDNYLNNYDFSSVDENTSRLSTTKKKKKKRSKKKKRKKKKRN